MGFSLENFIAQLEEILSKEQKAKKTIKELEKEIAFQKQYAKECGQL